MLDRGSAPTLLRVALLGAALAAATQTTPARAIDGEPPREVPAPTVPELVHERAATTAATPETPATPPLPAKPSLPEQREGSGTVLVPLVVYTPEMHLGVGGLVVQFFRLGGAAQTSRVSSVAFVALLTTRKQAIFELHPDFYWDDERNHVAGKLEYQRFPDSFWGVGPRTRSEDEEDYQRERLRFRGGPHRRFFGHVYAGLFTDLMLYKGTYPSEPTGIFATGNIHGLDGGLTVGVGPMLAFDNRDNTVATRSGTLLSATWLGYSAALGSRYEFWKLTTEARQFFPVGEESELGLRYYGEMQGGSPPYYQLAMLGGDELLRGYYMGRFRDKNLVALEAEYRFPLFWKFGAVAFGGAGSVADRLEEFRSTPVRAAGGGGLRLSLNTKERLNLRLDVGGGPETFGVYFTAREAF